MPQRWNELYKLLKNKKQNPSGGWNPSLPLILAAWHNTPAMLKILRLREHIEWGEKEGQLEEISQYLISLEEKDWYHLND